MWKQATIYDKDKKTTGHYMICLQTEHPTCFNKEAVIKEGQKYVRFVLVHISGEFKEKSCF